MPHTPDHHILNSTFTGQDTGLTPSERRIGTRRDIPFQVARTAEGLSHANTLVCSPGSLRIENLDRADPPDYQSGKYARGAFNRNVLRISADATMPVIEVRCAHHGFDPETTPIFWRFQCLHVLGRHSNQGSYRYAGAVERLEGEWQGTSKAAEFRLFDPADSNVTYDYGGGATERVMGGHGILSVAARLQGVSEPLHDFVHIRVGGTNPGTDNVIAMINRELSDRHANIQTMVRAAFAHESGFEQFVGHRQQGATMRFRERHHPHMPGQPDCPVRFDWPDDPEDFPKVTFDFGVGVSQYTRVGGQAISAGIVWDWRENVKIGINLLLHKLRVVYGSSLRWREWARRGWAAYNGGGAQSPIYAQTLADSAEGRAIVDGPVPSRASLTNELRALRPQREAGAAPAWPPSS